MLLHSVRQRARMFSAPHNIITATVKGQFNALDVYSVCDKKHVLIEAEYDFLRNETHLVIEEVKYAVVDKTDYIYSYFGGEDTTSIKGISSVSSGVSSGGGTSYIQYDVENDAYFSDKPFYSTGEISAPEIKIGANWTVSEVGTELLFKRSGVIKNRMLADGSFVAVGEITAYS